MRNDQVSKDSSASFRYNRNLSGMEEVALDQFVG